MTIGLLEAGLIGAIGLVAGLLGGLLGIGGSVVMIPALAIVFHDPEAQHLYQAAAMAVNVAVSLPAAVEHHKRGALNLRLFRIVIVAAIIAIVLGVLASNLMDGLTLRRLFAAFLVYVAGVNVVKLVGRRPELRARDAKVTVARGSTVGGVMGFMAGLLGIGGGVLAVPLIQTLCRLPLRQCIAVSSAAMVLSATVGATLKIATLGSVGFRPSSALVIALALTPTAILGGALGARLTHRLPLGVVRAVFTVLVLVAAWRLADLPL